MVVIYVVLEYFLEVNYNFLERFIFYFVKVVLFEDVNCMLFGVLVIIFVFCFLCCFDNLDFLISMKDVFKIIMCVEMLIKE